MAKGFQTPIKSAQPKKQSVPIESFENSQEKLLSYVEEVEDPRINRTKKHLLKDILTIAILAAIAGAEGWEDIENYGISKYSWLKEFLELPNGIPSDDTFRRVFERIKPEELERVFQKWIQQLMGSLEGEVIPIDGKNLRGSYDREKGIKSLNLVTAWASQQKLILGQVKVKDKSNEITAIPVLLQLLDIRGAIITIDAMGTQTKIVQKIQENQADYVLTLKENHPTLYKQVQEQFTSLSNADITDKEISQDFRIEKGHHRLEKRRVWAIPIEKFSGLYQQEKWCGLQTIVVVERTRHLWNKTTHEVQFYLSSLPADAAILGKIIRQHWEIENQVHWVLDVIFHEDSCRIRSGHSPRNFALLRRLALNALRQETTLKRSLRQKQKRAAMNNDYMTTILKSFCQA
ncbi:MAG: ISAs1 family transposase [Cyanobacteria bacterium SBLK]|nr:ISAs1 family transposase [Cyanobacteria bacterium SBLK]